MKKRKWVTFLIALYVLCLVIFLAVVIDHTFVSGTNLTKKEQTFLDGMGELVLVGDASFPPLSFTDVRNQFSGYEADLVKAIETHLGIRVKYVQMDWASALQAIVDGDVVGVTGMRVTTERAKKFHFTRPYGKTSYTLVSVAGTHPHDVLDQQNLKVAVQKGSATFELFSQMYYRQGIEYKFISGPADAMELLLSGEVDLWVESQQVARYSVLKADHTGEVQFESIPGSNGDYAMAFGKEYDRLVPIMNKTLQKLKRDGTFAALDKKWFGLTEGHTSSGNRLFTAMIYLMIIFTLLIVIIVSNAILKRMVNEKTEQHRLLLDNIPIQIWYLKDEETYGLVNKAHAEFLGTVVEEVEGKKISQMNLSLEQADSIIRVNRQVIDSGQPLFTEERICDANGEERILQITRTPKFDANGQVTYIFCSGEDITQRKLVEQALRESKVKIERLHEIALKMEQCRLEDDVYQLIVKAAEGILHFSICTVDVVEGEYFVTKAISSAVSLDTLPTMHISEGLGGKTYRTGKTYLVEDILANQDAKPASDAFRSAISAPIGDIGIFQAISNEVRAFAQEDVEMTELLLSHAAEAVKRIRSENKITYMSFHDSLTGLYNRAFFDQELERLDSERYLPLSIIMGDSNGLKLANDVFGHEVGDQLIIRLAEILKSVFRKRDAIFRWGGDEFAVLLPKTEEAVAQEFCSRVKKACLEAEMNPTRPSISLGVATKVDMTQNIEECLREAESRMYRNKLADSRTVRAAIIASLENVLWEKSFDTADHTHRVQRLALVMGRALELPDSQLEDLGLAAVLHDIGNISIPEAILKKTKPLTDEEWALVKRHAESGYRIAQSSPELGPIAEVILSHHERWDGMGYPEGRKGEAIPLMARIIAIGDAFDVMVHGRPYKKALSKEEALAELKRCAGTQFDPNLVELFLMILPEIEEA